MAKVGNEDVKCELKEAVIDRTGNLMDNSYIDLEKLLSLGWKPCYNLMDVIKATLKYYVEESDL